MLGLASFLGAKINKKSQYHRHFIKNLCHTGISKTKPRMRHLIYSLGQILGYDGCYDSGTCPPNSTNNRTRSSQTTEKLQKRQCVCGSHRLSERLGWCPRDEALELAEILQRASDCLREVPFTHIFPEAFHTPLNTCLHFERQDICFAGQDIIHLGKDTKKK